MPAMTPSQRGDAQALSQAPQLREIQEDVVSTVASTPQSVQVVHELLEREKRKFEGSGAVSPEPRGGGILQ